jgi:hypothetical protein
VVLFLQLPQGKQRKTAKEQPAFPLLFRAPNHRRPRISAENEMLLADNFLSEQQKQRDCHPSHGGRRRDPETAAGRTQDAGPKSAQTSTTDKATRLQTRCRDGDRQ